MIAVFLIFGSVLASLLPALILKVLMAVVFARSVSYLMILASLAVTFVMATMLIFGMGYDTEAKLDTMPETLVGVFTVATFVIQAAALNFAAVDQHGEPAGLWRWVTVMLLQYVVYFAIALVFVLAALA